MLERIRAQRLRDQAWRISQPVQDRWILLCSRTLIESEYALRRTVLLEEQAKLAADLRRSNGISNALAAQTEIQFLDTRDQLQRDHPAVWDFFARQHRARTATQKTLRGINNWERLVLSWIDIVLP